MPFSEDFGSVAETILARPHTDEPLDTLTVLVHGIRDPELCSELIEAELAIGPRQEVVALLNQQKHILEQNPDLTRPIEELPRREEPRDIPEKEVVFLDEDGNERDRTSSAASKVAELAADGGGGAA